MNTEKHGVFRVGHVEQEVSVGHPRWKWRAGCLGREARRGLAEKKQALGVVSIEAAEEAIGSDRSLSESV